MPDETPKRKTVKLKLRADSKGRKRGPSNKRKDAKKGPTDATNDSKKLLEQKKPLHDVNDDGDDQI